MEEEEEERRKEVRRGGMESGKRKGQEKEKTGRRSESE